MDVLVTGGAGFIGSHLCERLVSEGHRLTCVDSLDDYYSPEIKKGNLDCIEGEFRFINIDIRDCDAVNKLFSENRFDIVVHEAAQAGVRASVERPIKTNDINIKGTLNVLEAMRANGVGRMVFASSSSIYGKIHHLPFDEEHPKNPISPYGASKLACEKYLSVYKELHGIDYVALRYFTVYGPRIRPDLAIHKFTLEAMSAGKLTIYGDGSKTRDFTYVLDAVDATVKAMKRGDGAYNIGGGSRMSVRELAERIIDAVGSGEIESVPDQLGDVTHTESDTRKARGELGWKPGTSFDEGISNTIDWIREKEGKG